MDTIEQQAKEFLGSLSDKQLSDIKSAFNEAVNTLIHREQEKLDKIQQDLSDIKKQERELWDKQKDMEYSPEKTEIMNKRMALYSLIKIREFQIIHQINIVTAISNGGSIAQITDQFDNIHTSIPDFRNLKTENILFDEENILIIPKPEYIPVINEKIFESKGYIFDAIRISNDSYILSANEYKEGYSAEVTAEYMQPFILVTLDQLVLSMDYYYKKAKALAIQDAKEKTLRQEQYYDSLPAEKREKHFAQKDFYTTLPVNIKKKITQSEWEALDLFEKEKLFKPFKKYGSKRLVSKLEDNQMWVSFHDLYQRFVNKNAWPVNKDGELLVGKKAHGYNTFGNPETFKYWYWFRDMMNFKIKDIEIHRQDLSEIRKEAIETSFGERNTDITLKQEYGILVKRQSGEKINPAEIEQIREAWIDIQKAFGGLKEIADKINLKISHTANKHIFASKAIGVFIADMGTIGVSSRYGDVQFKLTLAHESGHMIDSYIGGLHGKRYATDDYEGSAGVLAFAFRNNMNKPKGEQSKYVNSTKECFARAFEQYYGMTILGEGALLSHSYKELDRTEPIYKTDDFVNKEKFETIIKPLVEKFLEENKEILRHINFEDMKTMIKTPDNLSQTIIEATEKLESNKETMKNHVAAIVKVGENEYNFFFPMAGEYNIGDKQKETEFEIVDIITIGETEPEQEPIIETEPEIISTSDDWMNKIPASEKYSKPVKSITYRVSPDDKKFLQIMDEFTSEDTINERFYGVYFGDNGVFASNQSLIIHIKKHDLSKPDYGFYTTKSTDKLKLTGGKTDEKGRIVGEPPKYEGVIMPKTDVEKYYELYKNIDLLALKTYAEILLRGNYINPTIQGMVICHGGKKRLLSAKYIILSCETLMKLGHQSAHVLMPKNEMATSPVYFIFDEFKYGDDLTKKDIVLIMPIMVESGTVNQNMNADRFANFCYSVSENAILSSGKTYKINTKITINDVKNQTQVPFEDIKIFKQVNKQNNTLPILDHYLVKDGKVTVSNLESYYTVNLVENLPDGIYSLIGTNLERTNQDISNFPSIENDISISKFEKVGEINKQEFEQLIKIADKFTADDELRPVMNGILFQFSEGKITICATDAHKLFTYTVKNSHIKDNLDIEFIVPGTNYLKFVSVFDCNNVDVYYSRKYIKFICDDRTLILRAIDGTYPKYKSVIPYESHKYITITKETLKKATSLTSKGEINSNVAFENGKIFTFQSKYYNKGERFKAGTLEIIKDSFKEVGEYKITEASETHTGKDLFLLMPIMADERPVDVAFRADFLKMLLNFDQKEYKLYFDSKSRAAVVNVSLNVEGFFETPTQKEIRKKKEEKPIPVEPEPEPQPEQDKQKYIDKIEVYREMLSETKNKKEKQKYLDKIEVYEEMITEI